MIALLVMTDGRSTVHQAIASADECLTGPISARVIHDDSGDSHRAALADRYPQWDVIGGDRVGFSGAIRRAWRHVRDLPVSFIFHLEDDFTFNRPADLWDLAVVLANRPYLTQMAFLRQPWSEAERAAGGIIAQAPADFEPHSDGTADWLEHRRFWTTNPCLYRRELCERPWPEGQHSEGRFGLALFGEDAERRSAFWGDGSEWVTHIGTERVGTGY